MIDQRTDWVGVDDLAREQFELQARQSATHASASDLHRLAQLELLFDQCMDLRARLRARIESEANAVDSRRPMAGAVGE